MLVLEYFIGIIYIHIINCLVGCCHYYLPGHHWAWRVYYFFNDVAFLLSIGIFQNFIQFLDQNNHLIVFYCVLSEFWGIVTRKKHSQEGWADKKTCGRFVVRSNYVVINSTFLVNYGKNWPRFIQIDLTNARSILENLGQLFP